jgi:hypothetical protein
MRHPTRTPRELRYWDHETDGPVPDAYWQQRAAHAKVMEQHQREVDSIYVWVAAAIVFGLIVSVIVAQLLGYGPIK